MEHEIARESRTRWNLKTGRGGLVDVEFVVQMLQLRHGRDHVAVRDRQTESALEALHREGLVAPDDFSRLRDGYRFLRMLESRLRLESDQAVEEIDLNDPDLEVLARRLGTEGERPEARRRFIEAFERVREDVRRVYEACFATA